MEMLLWAMGNKQMVGPSGAVDPYLDIYLPYLWNTSWALHLSRVSDRDFTTQDSIIDKQGGLATKAN